MNLPASVPAMYTIPGRSVLTTDSPYSSRVGAGQVRAADATPNASATAGQSTDRSRLLPDCSFIASNWV